MKDDTTAKQEIVSRKKTDMEAESAKLQDLARANIEEIYQVLRRRAKRRPGISKRYRVIGDGNIQQ